MIMSLTMSLTVCTQVTQPPAPEQVNQESAVIKRKMRSHKTEPNVNKPKAKTKKKTRREKHIDDVIKGKKNPRAPPNPKGGHKPLKRKMRSHKTEPNVNKPKAKTKKQTRREKRIDDVIKGMKFPRAPPNPKGGHKPPPKVTSDVPFLGQRGRCPVCGTSMLEKLHLPDEFTCGICGSWLQSDERSETFEFVSRLRLHIYVCVCMYVRMSVRTYVCLYVCMYVCMQMEDGDSDVSDDESPSLKHELKMFDPVDVYAPGEAKPYTTGWLVQDPVTHGRSNKNSRRSLRTVTIYQVTTDKSGWSANVPQMRLRCPSDSLSNVPQLCL